MPISQKGKAINSTDMCNLQPDLVPQPRISQMGLVD